VRLEVLGGGLISTNLHHPELFPLPFCTKHISTEPLEMLLSESGMRTVEICGADKGDVDTQIPMVGRAVEAQVDTERHRRPGGILRIAIEADLNSEYQ